MFSSIARMLLSCVSRVPRPVSRRVAASVHVQISVAFDQLTRTVVDSMCAFNLVRLLQYIRALLCFFVSWVSS